MKQVSGFELPSLHVPGCRWVVGTWSGEGAQSTELGWAGPDGKVAWDVGSFTEEGCVRAAIEAMEAPSGPAKEILAAAGFSPAVARGGFSSGNSRWTGPEVDDATSFLVMAFDENRIETWRGMERSKLASISNFSSAPPAMLGSREHGASHIAALLAVFSAARK